MKNFLIIPLICLTAIVSVFSQSTYWKAGVNRANITPEYSMWLAGYGGREAPSEGTLQDIWVKALALEDGNGKRAVLVTSDLLGFPKGISDEIRAQLKSKLDLEKSDIILNSSHTHCGPVLNHALFDVYPLDQEQLNKIMRYSDQLINTIVHTVVKAFDKMKEVQIYSSNGQTRFQVNRRNNTEATISQVSDLSGPNDYAVPVIKVETLKGKLMAIVFGYACHPTVLSINQWNGDYPGFAQLELEEEHHGAMAMFFQGAGADQNPLPRRTIPLARQYGRTLAAAVDRILEEEMVELKPVIKTAYTEIDLDLAAAPTESQLVNFCESAKSYQLRWGERMLAKAKKGEAFQEKYPYPIQVWKLDEQNIFTLGGELVVGYAIALKKLYGYDSMIMGYSNDVMSYIPTARILEEGGYEGASAQMVYGLPSTWAMGIEDKIILSMINLAETVGLKKPGNKLMPGE